MATKYVSSDNLSYFYSKIKTLIDAKLDASKAYRHPNSGVTAGTYRSVTVNAQGHVTAGTNPTTLAGYGITDAAAKNHTHNYAGSSSAGGSANSAVKLATARAINGVNFDGTGNIKITANPTSNQLTNQKLNDITTPGFYYAGGSNSVTNKPDGVDPFGMLVMKNASGYTEQILIDSNQKIYIRMYNASAWSNWSALYTTLNKPSKSDVGLGSVENKSSATIRGELTKANVTTALGYTPPTTNTTYSTGTSTYSGTTKLYSSTGSATDGAMTQAATTSALNGKANSSHTHQSGDIVSLDAGKLTGTISVDRLPAGALERCIVVADDTARKALTTAQAQTGDTVKVTSTGLMYMIVDDTKLNQDAGYVEYTAGSASRVPWSGVSGKPTTLGGYGITDAAAKNHSHNYAGSASAGGAAKSVANSIAIKLNGGGTEGTNLFTYNGSAGKTINITPGAIGAAASSHSHNYAGSASAGGAANSVANSIAIKLNGGSTEGTNLFTFNGSTAKTINITPSAIGAAASSHGRHVPNVCTTITDWNSATTTGWYMSNNASNAPAASIWYYGFVIAHNTNYVRQILYRFATDNNVSGTNCDRYERVKENGTWGSWVNTSVRVAVPSNAKFTDTTYSVGTASALGLTKLYTGTGSSTDGAMTQKAITNALNGKANSSHTHNYAGSGSAGGSANSAVKLATARTITLGGDLSGSASFDGSSNITISASVTAMTNTEIDKLFA